MDWRDAKLGAGVGPGWEPLVDELHTQILTYDPDVVVDQVKEKFGGLRYYWSSATVDANVLEPLVREYEQKAGKTCEWCGAPGETSAPEMRWLKTLCPAHTKAWADGERWW